MVDEDQGNSGGIMLILLFSIFITYWYYSSRDYTVVDVSLTFVTTVAVGWVFLWIFHNKWIFYLPLRMVRRLVNIVNGYFLPAGWRLPRFRAGVRGYVAEVDANGDGEHIFTWFEGPKLDGPVIVYNQNEFFMSEDAEFLLLGRAYTEIDGEAVPMGYVKMSDNVEGDKTVIDPPEELLGKAIPRVESSDSDLFKSVAFDEGF